MVIMSFMIVIWTQYCSSVQFCHKRRDKLAIDVKLKENSMKQKTTADERSETDLKVGRYRKWYLRTVTSREYLY